MSLFQQKLAYMGQTLLIKENTTCSTPLRSRVDPIQRLEPPKTPKECKKFCGLKMYLKDLQKRLIPIYKLFVHVPEGSSEEVNSNLQSD